VPGEYLREVAHPGVGPVEPGEEVVHHKYYQWVVFVLFLQVRCQLQFQAMLLLLAIMF
jgi:hypothetical protein